MDGELVAGEVLGLKLTARSRVFIQLDSVWPGRPYMRSSPTFAKPAALNCIERLLRLIRRVPALQKTKIPIVKGLHPQADAVDAQVPKSRQLA